MLAVFGAGALSRVLDALVENARQNPVEGIGEQGQVLERQLGFVQLALGIDLADDVLDMAFEAAGRRIDQGAAGGLDDIGQEDEAGLLALGLGAGITIILLADGIVSFGLGHFLGLVMEIDDERGAMLEPVDQCRGLLPGQGGQTAAQLG